MTVKIPIPAGEPADIEETVNQLLPEKLKKNIIRIAEKTGINPYQDTRQANMNAYFRYAIEKRDGIPESPESKSFKQMLLKNRQYDRRNDPEFILEYMAWAKLREDYNTICSWDPRELSFYIRYFCEKYYLPVPSLYDIFHMDVKQFFSSYLKKNVDKTALAYTTTIQKAIETLFAGKTQDECYRIQNCVNLYTYGQKADFDSLHIVLHKP